MSKAPEKKRARKADDDQLPPTPRPPAPSIATRVLPVQLQVGDRLSDETGEYEVIGRPYTTNSGKDVHVRVKRVGNAEIMMIRSWGAHERVAVKRPKTGAA
jgi:hypothetical protein